MTDTTAAIRTLGTSDMRAMGVDPRCNGDLSEWRAMRERNGCSVAQALGLGSRARYNKEDMGVVEPLTQEEQYDKEQEAKGWYRTPRAAEILKMNPLWLAFGAECGMIETSHGYGRGGEAKRLRVRLESVREWQALRQADNNGRPRRM